ncbi:MAG: ParA family protein [Desulfuromonas sp.]|nr:ParA family protein [Desulfuromonas sp.]
MKKLFVVTVASEKGGVGKTTIATNLAVYLKALHEDLPVTIASFDNHFSVDHMFALGPRPATGMHELLTGSPSPELVGLGQYGVQYIASARRLSPPDATPKSLRARLDALDLDGILILDTRPILDWFTEAALLAADLVLTPVKDRASLLNASALRAVLADAGRSERLWLVPSLVDTRARLNSEVRVGDFLTFSARERDYQVVDLMISKSPRVESLASGFASRIRPVLTHARQTAVHGQLRALADFVLSRRAAAPPAPEIASVVPGSPPFFRRLVAECPVCAERAIAANGHPFFDLRSRRQGLIHPECFSELLNECELGMLAGPEAMLVMELAGPGMIDEEAELQLHLFDSGNRLVASERVIDPGQGHFRGVLEGLTGRRWQATLREWVLVAGESGSLERLSRRAEREAFAMRRRLVLREAMGKLR